MTIQTDFYNWQDNPAKFNSLSDPFNSCNPGPQSLRRYLEERWGMNFLGCHSERDVRGSTRKSTHAYGASIDIGFEPGRLPVMDAEVVPFLIATSKETGVQAVHHYRAGSIWRPPGTSGRPVGSSGWKKQKLSSTGMGQPWANWFHIEFLPEKLSDGRPIRDKISVSNMPNLPGTPSLPPDANIPPAITPGVETVIDVGVTTLRQGSVGGRVKKMQALINANFMGPGEKSLAVDGKFGPETNAKVTGIQKFFKLEVDGICGPITWGFLENLPLV